MLAMLAHAAALAAAQAAASAPCPTPPAPLPAMLSGWRQSAPIAAAESTRGVSHAMLPIGTSVRPVAGEPVAEADGSATNQQVENTGTIVFEVPADAAQRLLSVDPSNIYLTLIPKTWTPTPIPAIPATELVGGPAAPLPGERPEALTPYGPTGYTPSELAERLDMRAPTLSFHLKGLVHARLVVSRREGRNLYYSPDFVRMNSLVGFLTENCCSLSGEACDADCQPAAQAVQTQAVQTKRKKA